MTSGENPFTPGFGQAPPVLAGRDDLLGLAATALASGPRHVAFTSLLLGPRGVGKTTLLAAIEEEARSAGWHVARTAALFNPREGAGPIPHFQEQCWDILDQVDPPRRGRLTGLSLPVAGGGAQWEHQTEREPSFQKLVENTVDAVVREGSAGVLLTLDEFHNLSKSEASEIATLLQHLTKIDQRPLAFLGVGLPHLEYTLLTNPGFTFFQRCNRVRIENISHHDAMHAIEVPFATHDNLIPLPHLKRAAGATRGYGYAIQSIGYHLWDLSSSQPGAMSSAHVEEAVTRMEEDVARNVTMPIWARLSDNDKRFLCAMTPDTGPSRSRDIAQRLGRDPVHVSKYRRRLLNEGVVLDAGRGYLSFANGEVRYRAIAEHDLYEAERDATVRNEEKKPEVPKLRHGGNAPPLE